MRSIVAMILFSLAWRPPKGGDGSFLRVEVFGHHMHASSFREDVAVVRISCVTALT